MAKANANSQKIILVLEKNWFRVQVPMKSLRFQEKCIRETIIRWVLIFIKNLVRNLSNVLNMTIENLIKNAKSLLKAVQIRCVHCMVPCIQWRSGYLVMGSCAQPVGPSVLNLYPNLIPSFIILSIWQMIGYCSPSFVPQNVMTSLSDDLLKLMWSCICKLI